MTNTPPCAVFNFYAGDEFAILQLKLVDFHSHVLKPRVVQQSTFAHNDNMKKKKALAPKATVDESPLVIDQARNLVFKTSEEMTAYFSKAISQIEEEYNSLLHEDDIQPEHQHEFEAYLESTLDEPDFIWKDEDTSLGFDLHFFIKHIDSHLGFYYIAVAYVDGEGVPTFVFTHFATKDEEIVKNYERGELVFNRIFEDLRPCAIEGDSLFEADPLAIGLFASMLKVRSDKDIPKEDFHLFAQFREETIEAADEIWKKNDMNGEVLVAFIKEFSETQVGDIFYIALTVEDQASQVHALLFSFPTNDESLVDRYRQGENLQAEEVSQESSH